MKVSLAIRRSQGGREARREQFSVNVPAGATLLDALDQIKDARDDSLAYRAACGSGGCGACGVRVDGRSVLACETPVAPLVDGGHVPVVAPLGNLPVIRDLVVDMEPFWAKHRAIDPAPRVAAGVGAEDGAPDEVACVLCGVCVSECVSLAHDPDFLAPAALAIARRHVADERESERVRAARLANVAGEHGAGACVACGLCNERCPKGVEPLWSIAELRTLGPGGGSGSGSPLARVRGLLGRGDRSSGSKLLTALRAPDDDDDE